MNLRILVVSQYFWPENFRINDLVNEWVLRGHQVTVVERQADAAMRKQLFADVAAMLG